MKIYLISALFILIGGVVSQDAKCQEKMSQCLQKLLTETGLSEADTREIYMAGLNGAVSEIMNKFENDKIRAVLQSVVDCAPATATGDCANDPNLKTTMDKLPEIKNIISTLKCQDELNKCRDEAKTESKVTQNEIDSLLKPDANREELFDKIGKERGCKFIEVFNRCHDKIKDQCGADEPNFKPVLEITKMAYDHLKCGCASAVASLILIFASILLIFYQKSAS